MMRPSSTRVGAAFFDETKSLLDARRGDVEALPPRRATSSATMGSHDVSFVTSIAPAPLTVPTSPIAASAAYLTTARLWGALVL